MRDVIFAVIFSMGLALCGAEPGAAPGAAPYAAPLAMAVDTLFAEPPPLALVPAPAPDDGQAWVDSMLAALSLDEKIGQLFVVDLPSPSRPTGPAKARAAVKAGVAGFLVPRLMTPEAVAKSVTALQAQATVPLFFAADYERGVGRFNNTFTELPANMALGAARDTALAALAGWLTAREARAIGVNLLFAPVVDVNNNAENPIINVRSYGEDPALVAAMAAAFVREAEAHGVLTTLKHFPGHGNTSVDTHSHMGQIAADAEGLRRVELAPFRDVLAGAHPAAGVMTAHLWVPAFDPDPLPATFSPNVLRTVLRDSLGFEGFVITDDIEMGALKGQYSFEERILRPLLAGADLLLSPDDLPAAKVVVREALGAGRLTEADLDRAVRHTLRAKARAGLHRDALPRRAELDSLLAFPHGEPVAEAIARRSVTLLRTAPVLPLGNGSMALVQLSNAGNSSSIDAAMDQFATQIGAAGSDLRAGRNPTDREIEQTVRLAREAEVVVLALYLRLRSGRGEAGLYARQDRLVRRLLGAGTPVVLVTFGNPYAITTYQQAAAHLVAYDQSLASVATAAEVLLGQREPLGRLPITVAPYPFGDGLGSVR